MKKVLITGGGGDIAKAIVHELELAGNYEVYAPKHSEMDVTDWNSIESVLDQFVPDILVNNAGYVIPESIKNADLNLIKRHIDINLGGTYYCTALALKKNPQLDIVNIGSAAATKIHATWSEYCATKAAVVMATKCWAEDGLYAVCVSPGRTKTKMRKNLYPDEDQSTLMLPEDFAKVVMKAIKHEYPSGSHINVHKEDVKNLLNIKY
jgi:NAD(P)-dependent dehydrogenase (short-subunit alcohol dehydrogenase family)